jgi:hypothetical protein
VSTGRAAALLLALACRPQVPDAPATPPPSPVVPVPTLPVDADGDGWSPPEDCDDDNWGINPGVVPEVRCLGLDADCDGRLDFEDDTDGDGRTLCDLDCDDLDPTRYPGAPDPLDGLDTDCDGTDGVGEAPVEVARGTLNGRGYASTLLTADVNGDGCDDLVITESGFLTHAFTGGYGESAGWLHAWLGCTEPWQIRTFEDPTAASAGIGFNLHRVALEGRDLVLSCTNFGAFNQVGGVELVDFATDPPAFLGEIVGEGALHNVDWCAVVHREGPEVVVAHLEPAGSGPASGFALPFASPPPSLLAPDHTWWPWDDTRHRGWRMLGWDRTGDGLDELLACSTWTDPVEEQAGKLHVYDGPGNERETWLGDLALGTFFGCDVDPAPDLPAPGDRGLLAGGEGLNGTGTLFLLPPVEPGVHTLDEASFELRGELDDEWFGLSAAVGDVNGDGHTDIVVGAPFHQDRIDKWTGPPGKVYVFLGPFVDPVLTRAHARVFVGPAPHSAFGWSLALADLDGDGRDEIYAGAPSFGHIVDPVAYGGTPDGALYRIDL